ncbi:MAG: hypothetical protein ACO3SO_08905 [Luteolibacter sp.]
MLNTRAIMLGIAGSLAMLAILGFSRLFNTTFEVADLTVREVELATITLPAPPPEEEPPPEHTHRFVKSISSVIDLIGSV